MAVFITAMVLTIAVRGELGHQHARSGWLLQLDFIPNGWPLIVANIAFYGYLCFLAFHFVRRTDGRERLFIAGWFAGILPIPLEFMGPLWSSAVGLTGILGLGVSFLVGISLLWRPTGTADSRTSSV